MRASLRMPLLVASAAVFAEPPARETVAFRLYKFQQPIGIERSIVARAADGTTSVRTTFSFTDRGATVPLAMEETLAPDGSVRRFAVWGSTSRPSRVDDVVELADGKVRVEESGKARSEEAPPLWFAGSAYAPVFQTELLFRYWTAHGKPKSVRLFPTGEAAIEARGEDAVKSDDGKPHKLARYALRGRSWG